MTVATAVTTLSDKAVAAYRRDGFLIIREPLFPPAQLTRLERIMNDWLIWAELGRVPFDLNVPHATDGRLFEFLADDGVLDLIERIIGPDIAIWTSQFFHKAPRTGAPISWHADSHYWTRFLNPIEVVTVWLALDDVSSANGCLRVVSGTHRAQPFRYVNRRNDEHAFFPRGVAEEDIDTTKIVDIELGRGEAVLFDGHLLHGSQANTSDRRRSGYTMRYMPTRCSFDPVDRRPVQRLVRDVAGRVRRRLIGRDIFRHRIYLARGTDRAGNEYSPLPRSG